MKLKTLTKDIGESRKNVQKVKELSKEFHEKLEKYFFRTLSIASPFVPLLSDPTTIDHSLERSLETNFLPFKQIFYLFFKRMQFNSRCLWAM